MRALLPGEADVLSSRARSSYVRVSVRPNSLAAWTDLTQLRGVNWLVDVDLTEEIDQYVASGTFHVWREVGDLSLAVLNTASVLNASGALLAVHCEVLIETATVPLGAAPSAGDWKKKFHGNIDKVAWEQSPIEVSCSDLAKQLLLEGPSTPDLVYGRWDANRVTRVGQVVSPSGNPPNGNPTTLPQYWKATGVTGDAKTGSTEPAWPNSPSVGATVTDNHVTWTYQAAAAWSALSARAVGAFTANPSNALQYWQCITAGTTGGSNPFPAAPTFAQTVTDGSVVWQYVAALDGTLAEIVLQEIIDDTLGPGVCTLHVPTGTNWYMGAFELQQEQLLNALTALSEQIGWDLRYAYDATSDDYVLTLRPVARLTPGSPVWTFQPGDYFGVQQASQAIDDVRTGVRVTFEDTEHPDASGNPTRTQIFVNDAAAEAKYGQRYMGITEPATSGINKLAVAQQLAQAALADLKEPLAYVDLELPYFWAVELNDYVTVSASGATAQLFTADQNLAVIAIHHTFSAIDASGSGNERTVLSLRGQPTMGTQKHLDKQEGGASAAFTMKAGIGAGKLSAVSILRGGRISFTPPRGMGTRFYTAELHVSTTAGFTPGSATLRDWGMKSAFEIGSLVPGTTYRAAIVLVDQRRNRQVKSAEVTFVADRVQTADIQDGAVELGKLPTWVTTVVKVPLLGGDKRAPNSNAKLDNATWDSQGITPGSGGTLIGGMKDIPARVVVRLSLGSDTSPMTPGCRAMVVLWDNDAGAPVDVGEWCEATLDTAGATVLVATYAGSIVMPENLAIRYLGQLSDGVTAPTLWVVRGPQLASTPYDSGSWMTIDPILLP